MKKLFICLLSVLLFITTSCELNFTNDLLVKKKPIPKLKGLYAPVTSIYKNTKKSASYMYGDSLIIDSTVTYTIAPLEFDTLSQKFYIKDTLQKMVAFYPFNDSIKNEATTLDSLKAEVLSGKSKQTTFNDIKDSTYIEVEDNDALDFETNKFSL